MSLLRPDFEMIQEVWQLLSDSRVPILAKLIPGLIVVGYCIFPVDLIPDPLLPLGLVDDLGILVVGLMMFHNIAYNYVGQTYLQPQQPSALERSDAEDTTGSETGWVDAEWYDSTYDPYQSVKKRDYLRIVGTIFATAILLLLVLGVSRAAQKQSDPLRIMESVPEEIIHVVRGTESVTPLMILGRLGTEKLEILQYTTQKVLEERRDCVFGPERLLYIAYGGAIIGIDLGKITSDDVQITGDGSHITLWLPPVESLHPYLDVEKSYVRDYRKPGVCPNHKLDMLATVQRRAKKEIEDSSESKQMLRMAETHAQVFMKRFLLGFGFSEVEVITNSPESETDESRSAPSVLEDTPAGEDSAETNAPAATDTPIPAATLPATVNATP